MLSGEYESVPHASIQWDREGRIRRTMDEASILDKMDSISRIGLIHPLVITREFQGVSGETRWLALARLGWDMVPIQWSDTLEEDELLAIELEENIKRTDLTWQDQCDALLRYHALQTKRDPSWTQEQTANAVGIGTQTVASQLSVAKAIKSGDKLVVAAKEYSTARGIVQRKAERSKADELSQIKIDLGGGDDEVRPEKVVEQSPIITGDFCEWVTTYSGQPFNLIHCDFPYGINADKFNQGAADSFGGYADTPETYWKLVSALVVNRNKLLGDSGHIIFWFSMQHYAATLEALREVFWVDPYPLIWHKSDNKGTLPDPTRGPRRIYEVAFLCSYGDRKIVQSVSNVFSGPTQRAGDHMSEKSQAMLAHFMRMVVDENTRLLDPTCGSGSALRAAKSLGASSILGLELNPEFADNARRALDAV